MGLFIVKSVWNIFDEGLDKFYGFYSGTLFMPPDDPQDLHP